MARVVLVHGVAQQTMGPETLLAQWLPALRDGLTLAGGTLASEQVTMAFYGDVFRRSGTRTLGEPPLTAEDVTDPLDQELLLTWWAEAARIDPGVTGPAATTRLRTPFVIQRALDALSHSRFFTGLADHLLVGALRQVRRYLTEDDLRQRIRQRVLDAMSEDTRLVVAHSLGSVVAYETLHAADTAHPPALITLGSPLGIRGMIFDRLRPAPQAGVGQWPPRLRSWTNIADRGDVVALVKALAPVFPGGALTDVSVHNGATAHDARPYLTARETGTAVRAALEPPSR
ncbi:hypothetical protein [Micromonospora sp. bgisy143]|uniref:hypothetical protein n=1 Tax=Micromonospora sp. bgisy143 TaxID=3413790 RepID=UPI003EC0BD41